MKTLGNTTAVNIFFVAMVQNVTECDKAGRGPRLQSLENYKM